MWVRIFGLFMVTAELVATQVERTNSTKVFTPQLNISSYFDKNRIDRADDRAPWDTPFIAQEHIRPIEKRDTAIIPKEIAAFAKISNENISGESDLHIHYNNVRQKKRIQKRETVVIHGPPIHKWANRKKGFKKSHTKPRYKTKFPTKKPITRKPSKPRRQPPKNRKYTGNKKTKSPKYTKKSKHERYTKTRKPRYGPPKKPISITTEPTGFGEPPYPYPEAVSRQPKIPGQGYGEPPRDYEPMNFEHSPVDSYSVPPKNSYTSLPHRESYSPPFQSSSRRPHTSHLNDDFPPSRDSNSNQMRDTYIPQTKNSYNFNPHENSHRNIFRQNTPTTPITFNSPPVDSYGAPLRIPNQSVNNQHSFPPNDIPQSINQLETSHYIYEGQRHKGMSEFNNPNHQGYFESFDHQPQASNLQFEEIGVKYKDENTRNKQNYQNLKKKRRPPLYKNVVVGGPYAEPPPRLKSQVFDIEPTDPDEFLPSAMDSDTSGSSYHSSYVNYKNSNVAFSPQNLNDVFSTD